VGPGAGDSALALDEEVAAIGHSFLTNTRREAIDLLVDCGRLAAGAPGQHLLLKDADLVVLVARPEPTSLVSAHWAATRIIDDRPEQRRPLLVTVGHSPLHPGEMAEALAIELLGTVPLDPVAAAMLSGRPGRPRALSRSVLISVAARLAHILETRCRGETLDPASDEALDTTNDQEHRDAS
jgi:Flp pilus assembly CpaE family ATPase